MPRSSWTAEVGALIITGVLASAGEASAQTVKYKYDALGRLIEVERPDGSAMLYTYDPADNRMNVVSIPPLPPPPPPPPPTTQLVVVPLLGYVVIPLD